MYTQEKQLSNNYFLALLKMAKGYREAHDARATAFCLELWFLLPESHLMCQGSSLKSSPFLLPKGYLLCSLPLDVDKSPQGASIYGKHQELQMKMYN